MLKVKSRAGESVQQMIRRFKKLCEKEGLIRDIRQAKEGTIGRLLYEQNPQNHFRI